MWLSLRGHARAHIYNGSLSAFSAGTSGAEVYDEFALKILGTLVSAVKESVRRVYKGDKLWVPQYCLRTYLLSHGPHEKSARFAGTQVPRVIVSIQQDTWTRITHYLETHM